MSLKVQVLTVAVDPPLYVECSGRKTTIGRSADAAIRLPDPTVSPAHATLRKRGAHYLVVDENSTNGTALLCGASGEAVWLGPEAPRVIEDGDRLLVGNVELRVFTKGEVEGTPSEDLASDLVAASLATLGHEITKSLVDSSLCELTDATDETLARPELAAPANGAPNDLDNVVAGARARGTTDLLLLFFGLLLLGGSVAAFYWLLA